MREWYRAYEDRIAHMAICAIGIVILMVLFFFAYKVDSKPVENAGDMSMVVLDAGEKYTLIDNVKIMIELKHKSVNAGELLMKYGSLEMNDALARICADYNIDLVK